MDEMHLMDVRNRLEELERAFAALARSAEILQSRQGCADEQVTMIREWLFGYDLRTGASGSKEPPTQNAE